MLSRLKGFGRTCFRSICFWCLIGLRAEGTGACPLLALECANLVQHETLKSSRMSALLVKLHCAMTWNIHECNNCKPPLVSLYKRPIHTLCVLEPNKPQKDATIQHGPKKKLVSSFKEHENTCNQHTQVDSSNHLSICLASPAEKVNKYVEKPMKS